MLTKEPDLVNKRMEWKHFPECLNLVLTAFLEEPMFKGLRTKRESLLACYPRLLEEWLQEGVSNVVWDEANQRVAGCGFNEIEYKGKPSGLKTVLSWCCDEKIVQVYELFDQLYGDVDIYEKYGVDSYFSLQIGATYPEYRGRGVHSMNALGRMSIAKENNVPLVVVVPTSRFSQRVYEKLGYDTVAEMPYANFRINGRELEDLDKLGVHKCAKLMVQRI